MMCHSLLVLVAATALSQAADRSFPGFVLWKPDVLERSIARLDRELGDKPLVFETIGNYERHSVYLVLRGKTSTAEVHETEADPLCCPPRAGYPSLGRGARRHGAPASKAASRLLHPRRYPMRAGAG